MAPAENTVSPPPADGGIQSLMDSGMFLSTVKNKIYAISNITTVLHSMTEASFQTIQPLRNHFEKHIRLNHIHVNITDTKIHTYIAQNASNKMEYCNSWLWKL